MPSSRTAVVGQRVEEGAEQEEGGSEEREQALEFDFLMIAAVPASYEVRVEAAVEVGWIGGVEEEQATRKVMAVES